MQVVFLAGGEGTRLRPITYETPKPLVLINGKPFLQHKLEFVKSFGYTDILLLVGYLNNKIEKYFGNGRKFGLNIEYSNEKELLGTGGALKNAANKLHDEFLLLNGDTFLPIDYSELILYFHKNNKIGTVTVYSDPDNMLPNNISLDKFNMILDYNKNSPIGMNYVDAGASVYKKEVLDYIPGLQKCSLEKEVFPQLIKRNQLIAFPTKQKFYDMGTFEGLKKIEGILK